jgi:hypothetical protein
MGQLERRDDLTHAHIVELHRKIDLVVKILSRQQDQVRRLTKRSDMSKKGRDYLRNVIREQRETLAKQKLYIVQLENELRLRGLE